MVVRRPKYFVPPEWFTTAYHHQRCPRTWRFASIPRAAASREAASGNARNRGISVTEPSTAAMAIPNYTDSRPSRCENVSASVGEHQADQHQHRQHLRQYVLEDFHAFFSACTVFCLSLEKESSSSIPPGHIE